MRRHICNIDEPVQAVEIVYKKTIYCEEQKQLLGDLNPPINGTLIKSNDFNVTEIENAHGDMLQSSSENGAKAESCLLHSTANEAVENSSANIIDNNIENELDQTGIFLIYTYLRFRILGYFVYLREKI